MLERYRVTSKEVREAGSLLKIRHVSVFVLLSSSIFKWHSKIASQRGFTFFGYLEMQTVEQTTLVVV